MPAPTVIIGGGISGLSAAHYLSKHGLPVTLVEQRPRLGGVIQTETVEGCVLEAGPDSFLSAKPAALELMRELGMADEVIGSNDHQRVTYIVRDGRMIPLPDGLMMMVPTRIWPMVWTPLLGWTTKIRMGLEYFRRPPASPPADRPVAEFIAGHYGAEAVDYLAEPLLAGVYGGDPARLSTASVLARFVEIEARYGSLTRGVLAERRKAARRKGNPEPLFRTLRRGLGSLVDALERELRPRIRVLTGEAEALETAAGGFRVRVGGAWLDAPHLVVATPAHRAGPLVAALDPELGRLLAAVEYSSSMTVALGYRRAGLNHPLNGFGFLVPKRERGRLVACTWVGTKFNHRVPEGWAVLRCFLGGADDHGILEVPDEEVLRIVLAELRRLMGVTAAPAFSRLARWPRSMAQYTVGHGARVRRIEERLRAHPGLHLAGNAYYGIGVPDCIRMGREAALRIARA